MRNRRERDADIGLVGQQQFHERQIGQDIRGHAHPRAGVAQATPRLLCSLVHKFGLRGVEDFDALREQLRAQPSPAVGELFIFVDESHRPQSGKLHKTMKALLPGAVFIGFTGTPLLKQDKATSQEIFGSYIHTYKFGDARSLRHRQGLRG